MEYCGKPITQPSSVAVALCHNVLSRIIRLISPKHQISKLIYDKSEKILSLAHPEVEVGTKM